MRSLVALISILSSTAALAADVDFSTVLTHLHGVPILDCYVSAKECESAPPLTLRSAAEKVLLTQFEDDKNLAGDKKMQRYLLAQRIDAATGPISLTAEEITVLKDLFRKGWAPLVMGRAWTLLDPAAAK